jgi:hypothetical protein
MFQQTMHGVPCIQRVCTTTYFPLFLENGTPLLRGFVALMVAETT